MIKSDDPGDESTDGSLVLEFDQILHIAVIMSLRWVSRAKCVDTQRVNQMNLITFQAAYHIE